MALTKHFFVSFLYFQFILLIVITSCKQIAFSNAHSDQKIEELMNNYVKAWSDGDIDKIAEDIYEAPLTIRYQDSVLVLGNKQRLKIFLSETFEDLENNNYGYSIINDWESKTLDENIVSLTMSYTRFLKDSSIMGEFNREASYILKKNNNGEYKIKSLIPKTPIK